VELDEPELDTVPRRRVRIENGKGRWGAPQVRPIPARRAGETFRSHGCRQGYVVALYDECMPERWGMRTTVVLKDDLVSKAKEFSKEKTLSGLLNSCLADWIA